MNVAYDNFKSHIEELCNQYDVVCESPDTVSRKVIRVYRKDNSIVENTHCLVDCPSLSFMFYEDSKHVLVIPLERVLDYKDFNHWVTGMFDLLY